MTTKPPVTVLDKVKKDLARGGRLEVECEESVWKDKTVWKGRWIFFLEIEDEGEVFRSQVVVWRTLEPKLVLTVNGLMAFAVELGVAVPEFPRIAGGKGVWRVEDAGEYSEDSPSGDAADAPDGAASDE